MIIVLTGPAGAGKTTVGLELAERVGWRFIEGDTFHPPENVQKMAQGIALTDSDRMPWLDALRRHLESLLENDENAVVACSALKSAYRKTLRMPGEDIVFIRLDASSDVLRERLSHRRGHFAGVELLESQLDAQEDGRELLLVDAHRPADVIASSIVRHFDLETQKDE